MYSCLVSTLLLPLFSAALPTTDGKPSTSWTPNQQQVVSFSGNSAVKFDNVGAGVGLGLPVRALQSLGAYSLLSYNNLAVVNPMNDLAGLKPFSKPNVLGYDVVFALQGQQTITAKYDDSITDAFNLNSFYFGCVVTNAVGVASTVKFTPDGAASNLGPANLRNAGFKNVDSVEFKLIGGLEKLVSAVLFDNFEIDVILKKGARYPG
ncbi:hypothetical protein KC327_g6686 [Hortaea werneckii]|nr:hypothetical protein KC358_g8509 [Hortaea werneckii]KAI6927416.1 hypothetical protein KC348_g8409 [Hortaea werneckii]KAI6933531.1 hypothetical protein KC341_g8248 [Hortaea werneckii]KAI6968074.1 hypothetical protein KC321_g8666 [Hortaea werneckii]KAI7033134.1 hypothetical protein KC362_g8741 [Hortaea werneckii]